MIALTFCTESNAISPSLPVTMILPSFLLFAGAISAAIGMTIPLLSPITAKPLTKPIFPPDEWNTLYSFLWIMDLSTICCSKVLANLFAVTTCSAVTKSAPSSIATSPEERTKPPNSLNLRVSAFFLPALRLASKMISSSASVAKCGILPSFLTS